MGMVKMSNKIAVIGAGKTGRGFIGRLLAEDNKEILFIDKNQGLVNSLNAMGEFSVSFFGNSRGAVKVNGYVASNWEDADLSDVTVIFVSVGGMNLKDVGAELKKLINDGKTRHIIVCENASHPAKTLFEAIGLDNVTVSESTVFCTTIENGDIDISSENYPYLQCDAAPLGSFNPGIKGVKPISGFENFLTRKLYTYNAASCVIAYLGYIKGYSDYAKAANDPEILALLDKNYEVTNKVLCKIYGYDEEDQREFAALSKQKFCDKTIVDTVARNAREPQRKLAFGERIIGPLCLIDKEGEDASVLILTAAAALLYRHESDKAWEELRNSRTDEELLLDVCGIKADSKLGAEILKKCDFIKNYMKNGGKLVSE